MFGHPSTYSVKVIDFGLSRKYAMKEHLHDTVGTVYTMAPEVLKGDYTSKVDMWSIGVIAFMLLSSSLPFYGKNRYVQFRRMQRNELHIKVLTVVMHAVSKSFVAFFEDRSASEGTVGIGFLQPLRISFARLCQRKPVSEVRQRRPCDCNGSSGSTRMSLYHGC